MRKDTINGFVISTVQLSTGVYETLTKSLSGEWDEDEMGEQTESHVQAEINHERACERARRKKVEYD